VIQHTLPWHGFRQRRGEQPVKLHRGSITNGFCGTTKGTTMPLQWAH